MTKVVSADVAGGDTLSSFASAKVWRCGFSDPLNTDAVPRVFVPSFIASHAVDAVDSSGCFLQLSFANSGARP